MAAAMMSGIAAMITLVLEPLKAASKHVIYLFKESSNVRSLDFAIRELRALKDDTQSIITNGERQNGVPTEEIILWLAEVETIEQKTVMIQEKHQQLCRCLWNISPNPWSNYKVSRRSEKNQVEVKRLCNRRASIQQVIMNMPLRLAQEIPTYSSKSPNLEKALSNIKNDSHNIIGIWGMGGVGKTHLLKQLNNELSRDGAFNVVVFVTCSKECSVEKVQMEIIKKLCLIECDSVEIRQSTIHNFLERKSFALLLDDLWGHVDLEKIGIPNPMSTNSTTKRKVVLTTRSERVCQAMEVKEKIRVNVLDWNASWNLFKGKANEEIIESNPVVQKYAEQVVKELDGLPLALITIGKAMSNATDPREWKHAVELLKLARHQEVEHSQTDETVFEILKFSYDKLRNDAGYTCLRECFLHCSLWPEDYEIKKSELVELWMGLGLILENDIHFAYDVGYNYIKELQDVCLLEATNKESSVKLHDVIRDMSLWIISERGIEWIVITDVQPNVFKEIIIQDKTEKLSVINVSGKISLSNTNCDGNITTLLTNGPKDPIPVPYCYRLDVLKELKGQSFSKLIALNLTNNGLKSVPIVICNIITLQFIDLSKNGIESLPTEMGALNNLKFLLLRGNMICTIPKNTISKMRSLQVLDVTPCYGWTRLHGADSKFVPFLLEELQSLDAFSALGIEIDDEVHFHEQSKLWNVPLRWLSVSIRKKLSTSFSPCFHQTNQSRRNMVYLRIKDMVLERLTFECTCEYPSTFELENLEKLHISRVTAKEILWKGLEPKIVLPTLKFLRIEECEELTSISWVAHLPSLQELKIRNCPKLKQLVIETDVNNSSFRSLKLLELRRLDELESICDPQIAFRALQSLTIFECDKLRKLPFRAENIPPKLNSIMCYSNTWWNNLEWKDYNLKSSLYEFVIFI